MTIKSMDSGAPRNLQNFNSLPEQTGKLSPSVSSDGQDKLEPYAGGTLQVDVYKEDTQRDFVWRGLYKHAEAAGLPHEEAVKFAENWSADNLMHQANGKTRAYTAREFAALKQKDAAGFDLNEQYSPQALNDLRQRQTAYRISQNERSAAPLDTPSISAPQYNDAERVVNWLTGAITSVTGEDGEIGKQFNRLSVSSLRLLGQIGELQNKATETINDAVRSVAPESIDNLLNKVDQTNRENAQALKNANSTVTNNDRMDDVWAAKNGINRPLAEDLHRKLMYFPEALPNAIDSAVRGDFKDDDGSYSDKVGKFIGGLNPIGDARDITANGKKVIQGDGRATIQLIASIVGAIPGGGDIAKPIIKAEKEAISEAVEGLVKTESKEFGEEAEERLANEETERLAKAEAEQIARRYDEISKNGHPVQRHGEHITEQQLDDRAIRGIDPASGTRYDAYKTTADGSPKLHNYSKDATKFTSKENFVKAEEFVKNSQRYKDGLAEAEANGADKIVIKDVKLEEIYGADYKNQVFGKTRIGSKNNPTGSIETNFTDGAVRAVYEKNSSGQWKLETLFPEPKN